MSWSSGARVAAPAAVIVLIVLLDVASGPEQVVFSLVVIAPLLAASLLGVRATWFYAVLAVLVVAVLGVVDVQYTAPTWPAQAVRLFGVAFGGVVAVLACRTRLEREARLEQLGVDAATAQAQARDADRMAHLVEVAHAMGDARSVAAVVQVVHRLGLGLLGAQGAALVVVDGDGRRVEVLTTSSLAGHTSGRSTELFGWLAPVARGGGAEYLADRAAALARHPAARVLYERSGTEASGVLPVRAGSTHAALWVSWSEPREFAGAQTELCRALAAQCAQALARIRAHEREDAVNLQVQRIAETLQRSLLTDPPQLDHLEIAVRYLPAAEHARVGGDWYDAFTVPDGTTMLVIGDIAGHDGSAAATMAQARGVLRGIVATLIQPPASLLTALDRALRDLDIGTLATMVLAKVDHRPNASGTGSPTLYWSNAGHPPPLLIRADAVTQLLEREPNLLLGLDPHTSRVTHQVLMHPGDTVVLYTDGLVERRGSSIDEGLQWLLDTAADLADKPLDEVCDALLAWSRGRADDDVALLAVRAGHVT